MTPIFRKNGYVPKKKVTMEYFFEIGTFILKYVLDYSESIPIKIFCLCHFFDQKWPKLEVFWRFLVEKNFFSKIFLPTFRNFYCGSFEPSYSCVPLTFAEIFPSEQIGPTSACCKWSSWVWSDQTKNDNFLRKILVLIDANENSKIGLSLRKRGCSDPFVPLTMRFGGTFTVPRMSVS